MFHRACSSLLVLTLTAGGCGDGADSHDGGAMPSGSHAVGTPSVYAADQAMQEVYDINVRIMETTKPETPGQRALRREREPHLAVAFKAYKSMSASEKQAFNDKWRTKFEDAGFEYPFKESPDRTKSLRR